MAPKKKKRPSCIDEPEAKTRLVIIGAGFAGLSAARTVQGAGGDRVEVLVLEAGTAVGGRACSGMVSQR